MEDYFKQCLYEPYEKGYVSYIDILDHFRGLNVYEAKKALNDYADMHDDKLLKMYDVSCKITGTSNYVKKLMNEDAVLNLLDDPQGLTIGDIDLLMIAANEIGYCNFLSGKENKELIDLFSKIRD